MPLLFAACEAPAKPRDPAPARASAPAAQPPVAKRADDAGVPPSAPATRRLAAAKQEIAIGAGSVRLGSATGSPDRDPSREADAVRVDLPGFQIDALPYPNDPAQPPRRLVDRAEAERLCEAEGKRLCSELEWERACKGDDEQEYPSAPFDAQVCSRDPAGCPSPFGVFALGALGREWTSSRAGKGLGDALRSAVVRGASPDAPRPSHRCAARDAATPDSKSESLLFRCCRGPQIELAYPEEPSLAPFEEQAWDVAKVTSLLASMPETKAVAEEFRPFSQEQVQQRLTASKRTVAGLAPWLLAPKGLLWSPKHGEQLGMIAGDTREGALLVVFYREASGKDIFAASYLTRGEHNAILVAYKPDARREVLFSTCWGCGGEGGAIEIGPDARARIVLR